MYSCIWKYNKGVSQKLFWVIVYSQYSLFLRTSTSNHLSSVRDRSLRQDNSRDGTVDRLHGADIPCFYWLRLVAVLLFMLRTYNWNDSRGIRTINRWMEEQKRRPFWVKPPLLRQLQTECYRTRRSVLQRVVVYALYTQLDRNRENAESRRDRTGWLAAKTDRGFLLLLTIFW